MQRRKKKSYTLSAGRVKNQIPQAYRVYDVLSNKYHTCG